jgi:methylated-DNA-[protein]-cysteine S-methyltransferase
MSQQLDYTTFNTNQGWVGILSSVNGLLRTTLPQPSAEEAQPLLGSNINDATRARHSFDDLIQCLRIYFGGHKTAFPDQLDLSGATPFQRQVWAATRHIPYGETRSYTWVAEQIGQPRAVRAVGQALGRNPLPVIIPCHRVITSNGQLGGYSGGVGWKRYLLNLEATASIK